MNLRLIYRMYKNLFYIAITNSPILVLMVIVTAILNGLAIPVLTWLNTKIIDASVLVFRYQYTMNLLTPYLVFYAFLSITTKLSGYFTWIYLRKKFVFVIKKHVYKLFMKKIDKIEYRYFEQPDSVETINKVFNEFPVSASNVFPPYVMWFIESVIAMVGMYVLMLDKAWWMIFSLLVPLIPYAILDNQSGSDFSAKKEKLWIHERKASILGESIIRRNFFKDFKICNSAKYIINLYSCRMGDYNGKVAKIYKEYWKDLLISNITTDVAIILNLILILFLYLKNQISIGLMISFSYQVLKLNGIYTGIVFPLGHSAMNHANRQKHYDKFFNFQDISEGKISDVPELVDIEFRGVHFTYPGASKKILNGVNFKILPGQRVSLVGQNGEGKSTIIKLLLGLFTPCKGEILINGRSINDYCLAARKKIFAPIFQDFTKYSLTLKENIVLGSILDRQNNERLSNAIKMSGVSKFLDNLKDGEDSMLNCDFDNGVDLSGGQWQRIAIARAIYSESKVLLLDEPTSQLDPMAESELYQDFFNLTANKSALFISHRLGSTKITDMIYVLKNGEIVEKGTHSELTELKGYYNGMFEAQSSWYK